MKNYICFILVILLYIESASASLIWTTSFGTAGSGHGQFNTPYGIRVHPITGDIWVADSSNSRLQAFKNDHSFSNFFDTTGHGDTKPVDIVFSSNGKRYVGDYTSGKVQIYDNAGNYIRNFDEAEKSDKLRALAIDSYNNVYTSDNKV